MTFKNVSESCDGIFNVDGTSSAPCNITGGPLVPSCAAAQGFLSACFGFGSWRDALSHASGGHPDFLKWAASLFFFSCFQSAGLFLAHIFSLSFSHFFLSLSQELHQQHQIPISAPPRSEQTMSVLKYPMYFKIVGQELQSIETLGRF